MVGFTLEETLGKTPIELCRGPLTDYDTVKQVVNSFFAGNAFQADVIYYRKDGSWFWGRSVTQPVKNEEGLVTEFFGIIEDITLEKEQEAQLNLLSKIAEDNVNAVIVADAHGNIEWVNRSFETMTGYSLQEVKGKKPGHFLQGPGTDPNTREYLRQQIGKGEAFECEILNYHKDGTSYWLRIHGQALKNEKGLVTKYFAIEEDITRQKEAAVKMREAEARFKLAIEKMGDNVWEHNFQTGDTMFSVLERDLVGYDKEEFESSADLWWKCVVEEDRHLLLQSDQAYRSGQQDQHSMEYRMRHKSGQIIWILDRGVVIERDKSGKPLRILGTHTNITHVKHTEAELAQRVKQFKSLSENIPGVIYEYEFRPDGTEGLRYVSPAIEEVFGISPADFVNYGSYIHPDDLPRIREKNKQSREQQLPFYDEARLRIPGGREIWHSVSSSFSYFTEDGSAVYTGFMQDITERKQAEQELEKQRKFYEDILNNMPADIAVFSPNHEYLFVNPKGIKDAELRNWIIGKRDEDYCQYRNKPLSLAAERRATFNKVLETKEASEWEERTTQENGDVGYVLRRWFPVANEAGNVELVLGYGVDITKRKMAEDALRINEEKYRGIIANMNLGMMEIDSQGKITFANQSFAQMTGKGADELIGTDSFQLLSEKSMAEYPDRLKRRKKGLSEAYELQPVLPGNNNAWWLVSAAPKFDEKGEFSGTIVITLDITAQKHLQHELEESREQAQQLAKAKETFLANMSHEIRTPMNAIMGLSRQLRKTKLDEQQRFFLDSVLTASDNLLVIINDILDLSKIEAGKLSLEAIAFSPKEMLGKVSHMLMHRAEEKGLWMQVSIDEEVGPIVVGDPYRLNQVLLNLAGNAIKFTANGGVTLGLHLLQEKDGQQLLRFSVIDTGIGISDEFKANMFEAFAQEYRSTSRNFGGTGLGLAISRQLVELMNGQLQVESEKGKGAIFSFDILLPKGNPSDLVASGEVGIEQNVLQGKNILLVEDNSMNRLVASTILGQYGARVSEAENGKTALEVLGADGSNIDLVLMDMQMPVMDGITATKLIRSGISSDLPVIALTANALPSEKAHCLEAGMNDFISKPFDETAFVRTIAQWLDEEPTGMQASPPDIVKQEQSVASTPAITSPYSLNTLQSISRGNESFVKKMAQMFCDQAPVLAEEMKAFLTNGQLDQMGSVAHKLKPTIDSMEMENLKEIIRMIEKAGKSGEHSPELLQWVNNTVEQIGMAVKDLKENYL
jgi:PAS domain S-box-containing protein